MYQKTVLDNGIRVISEELPQVKSISFGVWVSTGSRFESKENHGVSHFLEHLMFKGTDRYTAKELAEKVDAVGGQINAFTAKEYTCFYLKVLDNYLDFTADLLANMIFHSTFLPDEFEKERQVILEELHMYEDSPEDLIHDVHLQQIWPDNPLGRNILGTRESIAGFTRPMLLDYYHSRYQSDNLVIAAAGHLSHGALVEAVERYFGHLTGHATHSRLATPQMLATVQAQNRQIEQVHMCLSCPSITYHSPDIYGLYILNNLLGGAMSSRLFQSIREEQGLAYSVYSYQTNYSDCGLFTIYAGTRPANAEKVLDLILANLRKLKQQGISQNELQKSKEQLKGTLLLGLESSGSRMSRIARNELTLGRFISLDEVVQKINAVTSEQVTALIDQLFGHDLSYTAMGPLSQPNLPPKISLSL